MSPELKVEPSVLAFAAVAAAACLPCLRDIHVKNIGTKIVAIKVEANIPPKTPVPIERRAAAPAPDEITRGNTPRINASEVITIGRNLCRAAVKAASILLMPC